MIWYEWCKSSEETDWSLRREGKKQKTEAQMEGGMNRRATERKRKKVRKIERWVVDGSSGTLGGVCCLCVWVYVRACRRWVMASDVHVSLVSSSIRFIITCHQSRHLSISLSAPSVPLLFFYLPLSLVPSRPPPLPFLLRRAYSTPTAKSLGCLTPYRHFFSFLFAQHWSIALFLTWAPV